MELSHMVMGPSCGLVLADMGADVIKVEPVGEGDKTRHLPGSGAGFFPSFNRNKKSIALDIKSAQGSELLSRLVGTADVFCENFRDGALQRLDLCAATLMSRHPRLIYCSLKGFLSGPYEKRTALDEVVQMMGGLAYMTGPPGRPLRAGCSVNDIMGGLFAATGVIAALFERNATQQGQLVRSGLFENNAYLVSQHMMQLAVTGRPPEPMPARQSAWAIYDVFETSESAQVFVGVVSDQQWERFTSAFGLYELASDLRLSTNRGRVEARESFMPTVRQMFAGLSKSEILTRCEEIGLPFAPINRPQDMFDDPHLKTAGGMIPLTLEDDRAVEIPALPIEMNNRRFGKRLDLPGPGQHSRAIAGDLGYTDAEIDDMLAHGVISE
ncbi:CaiB/BaiF CoA transferase family protein [Paracoccus saliphilus]|uniref:CaiB/BaiF CoA transferase family protein n=1 Tax=Paracoccus saliphilus TaxID=405559 RepID=UPI00235030E4|nr:CaiB/BaiF CoA-transferase family protein [Paracoccus saliphilus]